MFFFRLKGIDGEIIGKIRDSPPQKMHFFPAKNPKKIQRPSWEPTKLSACSWEEEEIRLSIGLE